MRLFHFSEDPSIEEFVPRPRNTPKPRSPGFEWLNDPLVWAIDDWHQPMYLFPRQCPRILLWPTDTTKSKDIERFFGESKARMLAYIEERWLTELQETTIYRYEMPIATFESLEDAGMWVSISAVQPLQTTPFCSLDTRLENEGVELRVLPTLAELAQKAPFEPSTVEVGLELLLDETRQ